MGRLQILQEYWLIWLLFCFFIGMMPFVNSIESSFARSLISCGERVTKAPGVLFSGSAMCGDRLLVINAGQRLSSMASSLESIATIVMVLAAAVLSDLYGRKPILLAGMTCIALSIVLFIAACVWEPWARTFFILGQGLQGAFPVDMIFQQVTADIATAKGADQMMIFEMQGLVKFLPVVVFGSLAQGLQMLELENYLWLWCTVLSANCAILLLAMHVFPETRAGGPGGVSQHGILTGISHEIKEYQNVIIRSDTVCVKFMLFSVFIEKVFTARFSRLFMPLCMAYYSMSAASVVLWSIPIIFIHVVSTPLVGKVCHYAGMRKGFMSICALKLGPGVLVLFQPFKRWPLLAQHYIASTLSGWDALINAMNGHLFQEQISKYIALRALVGYGSDVVSAPMYAMLFDAKATDYLARMRPSLVAYASYMVNMLLLLVPASGLWTTYGGALDKMQEEILEQKDKLGDSKKVS